jgi:hypothetical protein
MLFFTLQSSSVAFIDMSIVVAKVVVTRSDEKYSDVNDDKDNSVVFFVVVGGSIGAVLAFFDDNPFVNSVNNGVILLDGNML